MDQQGRLQGWINRNERKAVDIAATAHFADGAIIPVRVTNISYEGCRIETDRMLPIGEKLKLAIPRLGMIVGQVRWSLQGKSGIQFLLEEAAPEDEQRPPDVPDTE